MTTPHDHHDDRSAMKTSTHTFDSGRSKLVVEYGLHGIDDQPPYFSITAEEYARKSSRGRWPKEPIACGAMHETILSIAPRFKPLVDLHLADEHGVPMYAVENGWYWFNIDDDSPHIPASMRGLTPAERAGHYLKVNPSYFEHVTTRDEFAEVVESLRGLFLARATAALEIYDIQVP